MTASVFDSAGQGVGARARAVRLMSGIRMLSMSYMIVAFRIPLRVEGAKGWKHHTSVQFEEWSYCPVQ